jgi:hypothetical protein
MLPTFFKRWQMDREPPLSAIVCTNLTKSAKNLLTKMLQNCQIFFKNICMKFQLHLVIQCPFSLLKTDFFKKCCFGGFFIAKISVENEWFGSYRIERRSKTNDYRPFSLVIGRIRNFATFDEILRHFAKILSLQCK